MIGDKLLIQEQHKIKAEACLNCLLTNRFSPIKNTIIGIGGVSGTGKSEHAHLLREGLFDSGYRSIIVSLDDYYSTEPKDRNNIRQKAGMDFVGHTEIIWGRIHEPLLNFKNRELKNTELKFQEYDKFIQSKHFYSIPKERVDVIFVEGLYAGFIRDILDIFIYLDGTVKETRTFRIERKKEEQNPFRQKVLAKEEREVLMTKPLADMVVTLDGDVLCDI